MADILLESPDDGKGKTNLHRLGGGSDTITVLDDAIAPITGYNIDAGSGDDIVTGSSFDDMIIGGTGNDTISGGDGSDIIFGGKASGSEGKDREATHNRLYGDSESGTISLSDSGSTGYADTIYGGDGAGGVGFAGGGNEIWGDYGTLTVEADVMYTGGSDTIYGGDAVRSIAADNDMVGDVGTLTLASNAIYTGGIDTIYGGTGSVNTLYGDVINVVLGAGSSFTGGADILVSGTDAIDTMYGDTTVPPPTDTGFMGGEDTFVFGANNGDDTIWDFRTLDGDKINLFDTGLQNFTDLDGHITENTSTNTTTIDLGQAIDAGATAGVNTIMVMGVTDLVADDFEFVDWMTA